MDMALLRTIPHCSVEPDRRHYFKARLAASSHARLRYRNGFASPVHSSNIIEQCK
jgi:hypothetical protein